MKKKIYVIVMILMIAFVSVLVLIIITEGIVIYKQSILIKRKEVVYAQREYEDIRRLSDMDIGLLECGKKKYITRKSKSVVALCQRTQSAFVAMIVDTNGALLIVIILTNTMGAFCTMLQEMRLGLRRLKKWMLQALQLFANDIIIAYLCRKNIETKIWVKIHYWILVL